MLHHEDEDLSSASCRVGSYFLKGAKLVSGAKHVFSGRQPDSTREFGALEAAVQNIDNQRRLETFWREVVLA